MDDKRPGLMLRRRPSRRVKLLDLVVSDLTDLVVDLKRYGRLAEGASRRADRLDKIDNRLARRLRRLDLSVSRAVADDGFREFRYGGRYEDWHGQYPAIMRGLIWDYPILDGLDQRVGSLMRDWALVRHRFRRGESYGFKVSPLIIDPSDLAGLEEILASLPNGETAEAIEPAIIVQTWESVTCRPGELRKVFKKSLGHTNYWKHLVKKGWAEIEQAVKGGELRVRFHDGEKHQAFILALENLRNRRPFTPLKGPLNGRCL